MLVLSSLNSRVDLCLLSDSLRNYICRQFEFCVEFWVLNWVAMFFFENLAEADQVNWVAMLANMVATLIRWVRNLRLARMSEVRTVSL